jgi:spore germination cell wall hydrolase CwlJ-like protein
MSSKLNFAGAISLAATFAFTLISADGSAAAKAQPYQPASAVSAAAAEPNQAPTPMPTIDAADADSVLADSQDQVSAASLYELVAMQASSAPLSRELNCLAGAIYFESKSEPLLGQLAVGRVVVDRSRSGRFPNSYCGVVFQPSQFSFVRGGAMPSVNKNSRDWQEAVAIAQIAHEGTWRSPVEGALYFHAAHVSPGWRMARVGHVGNHVFYR